MMGEHDAPTTVPRIAHGTRAQNAAPHAAKRHASNKRWNEFAIRPRAVRGPLAARRRWRWPRSDSRRRGRTRDRKYDLAPAPPNQVTQSACRIEHMDFHEANCRD